MSIQENEFKRFLGLNLKDAADKVENNEFTKLQNVYQASKGVLYSRFGTILDFPSGIFPLASRVSGVWRHYAANGERMSLYHCVPDGTTFPEATTDLTLTEVADGNGNIFGGGSVVILRVCYSWIGCGLESTYNSSLRSGFPAHGSFPLYSYQNPGHQTITLGSATSTLSVVIPAFPTGVSGANIFLARGTNSGTYTAMTYMGTVSSSQGQLLIREFIGPVAAANDTFTGGLSGATAAMQTTTTAQQAAAYAAYQASLANVTFRTGSQGPGPGAITTSPFPPGRPYGTVQNVQAYITARDNWQALTVGSGVAGLLNSSDTYYAVIALVDAKSGHNVNVSSVITASGTGTSLSVTLPPFPAGGSAGQYYYDVYAGLTGAIFRQMTQQQPGIFTVPCVPTASGLLTTTVAAPPSTNNLPTIAGTVGGGNLVPGTYWVAFAWVIDPRVKEGGGNYGVVFVQQPIQINLLREKNSIAVTMPSSNSGNGAQAAYVFVGTQPPSTHPMTCIGIGRAGGSLNIPFIPGHNAQSCPSLYPSNTATLNLPLFATTVNDGFTGGNQYYAGGQVQGRFGFMMAHQAITNTIQEVFPSRTLLYMVITNIGNSVFSGDSADTNTYPQLHNWAPQPKTQNDKYTVAQSVGSFVQPFPWTNTPIDPSFCYLLGLSYFVNGADIPWVTDGYTLGQLGSSYTENASPPISILPPIGRYIFVHNNSLVLCGAEAGNQLYASNANTPTNWASGGFGTLLRFATVGDAVGSGITAMGLFTPRTQAVDSQGGPGSYLIAFKKVGAWMIQNITDAPAETIAGLTIGQQPQPMMQVSGRAGCVAYRSIINTPKGTIYFSQESNFYLITGIEEPRKIGTKVQNLLSHLVGNDALMRMCTASYHDNHYKFSYPSPTAAVASPPYCDSELWADLRTDEGDPITWVGPHQGRNIGAQIVLGGDVDDLSRLCADSRLVRSFTADSITTYNDLSDTNTPAPIVKVITSKIYRLGADAHFKRILGANLDLYLDYSFVNQILMEFYADAQYQQVNKVISNPVGGGATWDASKWDGSNFSDAWWPGIAFLLGQNNLNGRTLIYTLTHANAAPFALASTTLLSKTETRRMVSS